MPELTAEELNAQLEEPSRGIDRLSYHEASTEGASFDLAEIVRDQLNVSKEVVSDLAGITAKTLKQREDDDRLKPSEVDRLLRVFKVILEARDVLKTVDDLRSWLKREQTYLGGEVPLELLQTEAGTDMVLTALKRIKHSVIA